MKRNLLLVLFSVFCFSAVFADTPVARIFAYDLRLSQDGDDYTFSFKANQLPTTASLIFYNETGREVGEVALDGIVAGSNSKTLNVSDLPGGGTMTWGVKLHGERIENFAQIASGSDLKKCHLAIDNCPESDYFGRIYVANRAGKASGGVYIYNQDYSLHTSNSLVGQSKWESMGRPSVGVDGTVYLADWGDDHGGIYVMNPKTLTSTCFFNGTQNSTTGLWTNAEGVAMGSSTAAVSVYGSGAGTILYAMNEDASTAGTTLYAHGVNVYQIGQADGSVLSTWNTAPTRTFALSDNTAQMFVINANEHGAFFSCSRSKGNNSSGARSLQFYNKNGVRTFVALPEGNTSDLTGSLGGGCAVSRDLSELSIVDGDGNILVYGVTWTDDTPALTYRTKYTTSFNALGTLSYDYAGNLLATAGTNYNNSTANKLVVYTVPTENNECTVPAKKALTVYKPVIHVTSVTPTPSEANLAINSTINLAAEVSPAGATYPEVTWTSSNTSIATVSAAGVVTAKALGDATITATADGITGTCTIHVCAPVAHILPYNLNRTLDGSNYTFSFKSNIAATSGKIIFYQNGVKKGEVAISDPITAGANEVVVAKSALPQIAGVMTWAVELTGADSKVVGKLSDNADKYRFYHLRSIGINVYPETDGFGNIYVNMGLNGSSDGSCTRTKEQTKGIFQFDAALNLKNPTNSGYTGGISWPNSATAPFRIAIGEDGLLYASGDHASYAGVWVLDNPDASAGTFRSVISGHQEQGLYVSGTGSQRKLYTTENGSPASIMEYAIGNNVPYTGDGRVISTCADAKLIYGTTSNMNIATDGKGGLWIYEYRAEENSTYVCLTHLNSSGTRDYDSNSAGLGLTASQRGGFAVNAKKNLMACGTVSKVTIFSIAWNGSNVPILTKEHEIPINGSNIDCIAFDYADNLFVGTSTTEYLFVYALPTAANKTEVPAKSTLTVEAFDHIDVSSVTINEGAQSIERGNTFTYTATVLPANASDPSLTWASDDEDVAIVNETTGEVTAVEVGTAHITATADGVTSSAVTVTVYKLDFDVTWVPNGATVKTTAPATNNALWQQFMTDYNAYYSMSRGAQSLTLAGVRSFLNNTHCIDFMTSSASPWKWLGDYILPVATAAGRTLDTEMKWSFDIAAFFNALPSASGEYGYGDYTTAGQPAQWLPYWKVANNYLPATLRAEDALPILNKGNDHFDGWYDNSGFTGSPVTSVTADITLYAKWSSPLTLDETLSTNGATITANNGKVMNVLFNRRFSVDAGLYTLVLPFDLTDEQLQEAFGADYQLSVLHDAYMKTPELMYLKFDHVNNLIAGEPCLLQVSKDVNEDILFRDVTIDKTDRSIQFAGDHDIARMIGLYDQTDIPASAKDYYLGNNNYLFQYKSTTTTKGFRAYFHFPDFGAGAPPRARVVFHDDTTTDVEPVEAIPATIEPQKVIRNGELIIIVNGVEYDVTGRVRVR